MASTGFTLVGTGASVSGTGTTDAWSDPGNITADDTNSASVSPISQDDITEFLEGTNLGLAVPSDATITGVEFKARYGSTDGEIIDRTIQLIVGGSKTGDNKSAGATWSTTISEVTFGGASDLWGLSLTPADVNASDFGGALQGERTTGGPSDRGDCEAMWLNVHYDEATGAALSVGRGLTHSVLTAPRNLVQ